MAAPTFRSFAEASDDTVVTSLNVGPSASIADDDILYILVHLAASANTPAVTGFSVVTSQEVDHDGGTTVLLRKVASSESGAYAITWTGSSKVSAIQLAVIGADTTTPEAATPTPNTGSGTGPNPPDSGTVASGDYLALAWAGQEGKSTTRYTAPPDYPERGDIGTAGSGSAVTHGGVTMATQELVGVTSEAPDDFVSSVSDGFSAGLILIAEGGGEEFTETVTDPVGVTDDTSRVHDAARTPTDPVGVTDDTSPAKGITVDIVEAVGVTDDTTPVKAATAEVTDAVGVTDTPISQHRTSVAELGLSDPTKGPPVVDTGHIVRYKARSVTGGDLRIGIYDGALLIEEWDQTLTATLREYERTLAAANVATITDYNDLRVRLQGVSILGEIPRVSWIAIEVPQGEAVDHVEEVTDPVGVTDDTTPVKAIAVTITDAVGVTDDTTPVLSILIDIVEAVGVTDDTSRVHDAVREITDLVDVLDTTTKAEDNAEAFIDPVGVTDDTTRVHDAVREQTDPVGVTDDTTPVKSIAVEITEAVGVTDDTTRVAPAVREVVEPVGVTDDTSRAVAAARTITDDVGVTDDTPFVLAIQKEITDPVGVTDDTTRAVAAQRTVTDPVGVTDDTTPAKTINVTINEAVGVTDDTAPAKAATVTIVEAVGVTDEVLDDLTGGFQETVIDPVGVTDDTTPAKTINVTITEAVGVTDDTAPAKAVAVVVVEPVGVTDDTAPAKQLTRTVNESVGVTDDTSRVAAASRTVNESVGVTDLVTVGALFFWRQDKVVATADPVAYTPLDPDEPNPLP